MFLQRSACLRPRIDGLRFWLPQWGNCGHISDVQKGVHIFHIGMLRSIKIQHILFMYELWKRNWWNQSNNPLWFQSNLRFNTYRVDKSGKNAIYILKVILSRWNYNVCFWFRKNHGWRKFNFLWRTKYKGALKTKSWLFTICAKDGKVSEDYTWSALGSDYEEDESGVRVAKFTYPKLKSARAPDV